MKWNTDALEDLAQAAIEGQSPCLSEDQGEDLANLIKIVNAETKIFNTLLFSNVIRAEASLEMIEGIAVMTLIVGSGPFTRKIILPACAAALLADEIQGLLDPERF